MPNVVQVNAEPADEDRPRHWGAVLVGPGSVVQLTHYAVLAPGEELTETPPRRAITWAQWLETHAEYGLGVDGRPLEVS